MIHEKNLFIEHLCPVFNRRNTEPLRFRVISGSITDTIPLFQVQVWDYRSRSCCSKGELPVYDRKPEIVTLWSNPTIGGSNSRRALLRDRGNRSVKGFSASIRIDAPPLHYEDPPRYLSVLWAVPSYEVGRESLVGLYPAL